MEFIYSEDYSPIDQTHGKQTLMKIVGESTYIHYKGVISLGGVNGLYVTHIPKPSYMSLCENVTLYTGSPEYKGQGHFSLINNFQCHPNSYIDIMNKIFHIPDFFSGGNILTLSDKVITIWEEGLEVHNTTRLKNEDLFHIGGIGGCDIFPIRFFIGRNNIKTIEGTGRLEFKNQSRYQIYINEYNIPIGSRRSKTNTAIPFTNEEEYKTALTFLIDNLFSGSKSQKDLLDIDKSLI